MEREDSPELAEQDPEPTEEGSPVPDPEGEDTNAEDIPSAD
jgi:hypothetical protein